MRTELPPGPPYSRWLTTLGWTLRPWPFMERCRDRYGDAFTMRIAHEGTWVFMSDPDAVKQVFKGDPRLLHAGEGNIVLKPFLGDHSVLLLDEEEHMTQRKLLLPPLHGERMHQYGELMTEIAEEEIRRWPVGEAFSVLPRMQAITLEVIMRAVFGVREEKRLDRLRAVMRRMLEWGTQPARLTLFALIPPERLRSLPYFRRGLEPLDELLYHEIRHRRDDPDLAEREDILSLLVQARHEDGNPMSDAELRDELLTLLIAGHETTATALSWAVERLLRHPDKLQRLRDEVAAGEDEYLDAVIKETLRLRPVLAIVARRLTEPMEIGGWNLPAGVSVAPCIYLMHRRPDVYPEPERFLPERFVGEQPGTYTWIPFGGGVRRCLGGSFAMFEMKMVLSALARHADLRPSRPESERVRRRLITMTPSRGGEVFLGSRNGASAAAERVTAEVGG
jgi:cytochrome P450